MIETFSYRSGTHYFVEIQADQEELTALAVEIDLLLNNKDQQTRTLDCQKCNKLRISRVDRDRGVGSDILTTNVNFKNPQPDPEIKTHQLDPYREEERKSEDDPK